MTEDQTSYWRSASGDVWAAHADRLNAMFAPVTAGLIRRAALAPGHDVLDIGCGAGTSSRRAMAAVLPGGSVLGVDLAPNLVAAAEKAAAGDGSSYRVADAQADDLGRGAFDRIISQFGVMFFPDTVAAFANIRRAARAGAWMALACWGGGRDNPWLALPHAAAAAELGETPGDPDGPGPTRLRDTAKTAGMLESAGWTDVNAEAADLTLTPTGTPDDQARFCTVVGPAARALRLRGGDAAAAERVAERIRDAFSTYAEGDGVRIPARINFYTAAAPGRASAGRGPRG